MERSINSIVENRVKNCDRSDRIMTIRSEGSGLIWNEQSFPRKNEIQLVTTWRRRKQSARWPGCVQVRDGLEEAELDATWNQRKRKRRGTEDRIFQSEIIWIASIVSMYKYCNTWHLSGTDSLKYFSEFWHRNIILPFDLNDQTMTARLN